MIPVIRRCSLKIRSERDWRFARGVHALRVLRTA
jgi:hypothetical protein